MAGNGVSRKSPVASRETCGTINDRPEPKTRNPEPNEQPLFPVSRFLSLFIIHFSLFIAIAGCGYKPTSHYIKPVVEESVSTQIVISMKDPDNTVLLKDALNEAVVNRFRTKLTDEKHAKTHLLIALRDTKFDPVRYDRHGYIIAYRAIVWLDIDRMTGETKKRYHVRGTYQFTIEPNAIITDIIRYDAIRYGAQKALDSFVAQVAAEGSGKVKNE